MDLDSILKSHKKATHSEKKQKKDKLVVESLTNREIVLSPSVYSAFEEAIKKNSDKTTGQQKRRGDENQKNSRNRPPAQKKEEGKYKNPETDREKTTKNTNQNSPESARPKTSDKEDDKGFDFKTTFGKKSPEDKKSFKKIYDKSISNKKRLFSIDTDIIWISVAFGCVIGVILFYFQGLQPLILNNYTIEATNQIEDLNIDFREKGKQLISTQNDLYQNSLYNPLIACSQNQNYTEFQSDSEKIAVLENSLNPNAELKNLPDYKFFSETETKNVYTEIYQIYLKNTSQLEEVFQEVEEVPNFLNYRNNWIETCEIINNPEDIQEVKLTCANLLEETRIYREPEPRTWNLIENAATDALDGCQEVDTLSNISDEEYSRWKIKWNTSYDEVMKVNLKFDDDVETINKMAENFSQTSIEAINRIDKIYNDKIKFENLWYLLEINI